MALLDISEYSGTPVPGTVHQAHPAGREPKLAFQQITFTGTAASSAAFGANTKLVRIIADSICRVRFTFGGTADAATASTGFRMSLGVAEYFNVKPGDSLSVIVATP